MLWAWTVLDSSDREINDVVRECMVAGGFDICELIDLIDFDDQIELVDCKIYEERCSSTALIYIKRPITFLIP